MIMREVIEAALLALGVLAIWIASLGFWAMENVYDRLHCIGLAALLAPAAVTLAVVLRHSSAQAVIKVLLLLVITLIVNPVLTHATARAAMVRDAGGINLDAADTGKRENDQ